MPSITLSFKSFILYVITFDLLIEYILNNSSDHLILLEALSKTFLLFKLILTKSPVLNFGFLLVLL